MAGEAGSANTILKILSGAQSGAEVSLSPGEYVIGSGAEDDIQIIDVSLKPGHARIRVSPGKIEIRAAAGSLKSANGIALDPDSDWHEVEPLDTLTAGTTRFALGAPTAQWTTIAEAEAQQSHPHARPVRKAASTRAAAVEWLPQGRQMIVPLVALALLVIFAVWQLSSGQGPGVGLSRTAGANEVEALRKAIGQLPFAQAVRVRQDVDSTIFVTGFVDAPVERRAVMGAVERTGIPARVRVAVLQSIRAEIDGLIKSENISVTASVSPDGELLLDGVILDEQVANKFVELVKDRIVGVAGIVSRIKTANTLLAEVEKLAQVTQIGGFVLLRVDRDLIEATGAVPLEKIDAWVGFLQAFARRFARDIALRSFVQLQSVTGGTMARPNRAIIIGGRRAPGTMAAPSSTIDAVTELDVERLRQGAYGSSDVLVGDHTVEPASGAPVLKAENEPPAPQQGTRAGPPPATRNPLAVEPRSPQPDLTANARELLEQWRNGTLDNSPAAAGFKRALDALSRRDGGDAGTEEGREQFVARFQPLFASRHTGGAGSCWPDSHLTASNVAAALFWLDMLSVSAAVSLKSLPVETQALLLEAALSPRRTERCAGKMTADLKSGGKVDSLYLAETSRNPDFVRFITRDLRPFTLDITGANLGPAIRFVQLRTGRKYLEGAAPDRASRIALVGELGVAIQLRDGMSSIVFGPDLTWLSE